MVTRGKPAVSVPPGEFHLGVVDAVRMGSSERALLGLATIEVAGPVIASIPLPRTGAVVTDSVLSCELVIAEPAPVDAAVDVELRCGSASTGPIRLDAAHRRVPVALTLTDASAASIEIRLTDGGNGIVGDSIALERACIVSRRR